jgi:AcrR family transcriptional regulator
MAAQTESEARPRVPLSRDRVLRAAINLADKNGIEALSMRRLGQELGVEAMSLYNHVANKEDVLDGITELILGEINDVVGTIEAPPNDWKMAMRQRVLAARQVLLQHPWAPEVMESRSEISASAMHYYDSLIGLFLAAGFSVDLTHHAMHTLGSRALGFTQELYDDSADLDDAQLEVFIQQMAPEFPHITAMVKAITHDVDTTLGWCDDQTEFEFALDLILDGLERLRDRT